MNKLRYVIVGKTRLGQARNIDVRQEYPTYYKIHQEAEDGTKRSCYQKTTCYSKLYVIHIQM